MTFSPICFPLPLDPGSPPLTLGDPFLTPPLPNDLFWAWLTWRLQRRPSWLQWRALTLPPVERPSVIFGQHRSTSGCEFLSLSSCLQNEINNILGAFWEGYTILNALCKQTGVCKFTMRANRQTDGLSLKSFLEAVSCFVFKNFSCITMKLP